MRTFWILWKRESLAYFLSPVACLVTVFFLIVMGISFWMMVTLLAQEGGTVTIMSHLFGSIFFWMALLMVTPLLTMRLFAEERRSGTFELLMTAPVRDAEAVLAKYAAALTFYVVLWIPTLAYAWILQSFSPLTARVDAGALAGGYAGALVIGAFFLAIGLLASALARSQIVAAIMAFASISAVFFAGFFPWIWRTEGMQRAGAYFSPIMHMVDFSRGVVDSRPLSFYAINTVLVLFATIRVIEARKGK